MQLLLVLLQLTLCVFAAPRLDLNVSSSAVFASRKNSNTDGIQANIRIVPVLYVEGADEHLSNNSSTNNTIEKENRFEEQDEVDAVLPFRDSENGTKSLEMRNKKTLQKNAADTILNAATDKKKNNNKVKSLISNVRPQDQDQKKMLNSRTKQSGNDNQKSGDNKNFLSLPISNETTQSKIKIVREPNTEKNEKIIVKSNTSPTTKKKNRLLSNAQPQNKN